MGIIGQGFQRETCVGVPKGPLGEPVAPGDRPDVVVPVYGDLIAEDGQGLLRELAARQNGQPVGDQYEITLVVEAAVSFQGCLVGVDQRQAEPVVGQEMHGINVVVADQVGSPSHKNTATSGKGSLAMEQFLPGAFYQEEVVPVHIIKPEGIAVVVGVEIAYSKARSR